MCGKVAISDKDAGISHKQYQTKTVVVCKIKWSKQDTCTALYNEWLISKALRYGMC